MATELYRPDSPFDPVFSVDADLVWTDTLAYQVSKRAVEGVGEIADFIAATPRRASLEGTITAMTLAGASVQPQKLTAARDALEQLADQRQPVLVVSNLYTGYLAIERAEVTQSADGGMAIVVRISFVQIKTTETGTAQVPASKLRAKVKRRGATGKKGGSPQGATPEDKTVPSSLAAKAAKFLGVL